MKKRYLQIPALLLALVLLLSLTGCSIRQKAVTPEEDRRQLEELLSQISANLHPATAGSSLTSARMTVDLILWAANTDLSRQEITQVVEHWLAAQSPDISAAFAEKLQSIQSSLDQIVDGTADGLLDAAGIVRSLPELGSSLRDTLNAILASGGLDR